MGNSIKCWTTPVPCAFAKPKQWKMQFNFCEILILWLCSLWPWVRSTAPDQTSFACGFPCKELARYWYAFRLWVHSNLPHISMVCWPLAIASNVSEMQPNAIASPPRHSVAMRKIARKTTHTHEFFPLTGRGLGGSAEAVLCFWGGKKTRMKFTRKFSSRVKLLWYVPRCWVLCAARRMEVLTILYPKHFIFV